MKLDRLGLNHSPSCSARFQTVRPLSLAVSAGHLRITPPQSSTLMPRCFAYHVVNAFGSFAFKNTPPMPVTRAIRALRRREFYYGTNRSRLPEVAGHGVQVVDE